MERWLVIASLVFSGSCAWAANVAEPSTPVAAQAVTDATGAALQADAARALEVLRSVPAREFHASEQVFRDCMMRRFGPASVGPAQDSKIDAVAGRVLQAYQGYWRSALLKPSLRESAERTLLGTLRRELAQPDLMDMDAVEPLLAARLTQSGYYSLQGRTGPLRELMLWTSQQTKEVEVALPEAVHATKVVYLDGVVSGGWSTFATCERRGTGGWATTDALFAVVPRYPSLDDEAFRVSFLGHETQHFVDLAQFPGMASWELEYRAKLVELALAEKSRPRLLLMFTEDQGDDPALPHAYANRQVLAAMRKRLGLPENANLDAVEVTALQGAAAEELRQDSQRRRLAK